MGRGSVVLFRELCLFFKALLALEQNTQHANARLFPAVRFLIRYVAPLGILALILSSLI